MADQILSPEEIDALLSAMDKGEVDLKPEARGEPVIQEYSLTSRSTMLRGQFFALEEVYDRFATKLGDFMSGTFQQPIEVGIVSSEMIKYGDFISTFSTPTSMNVFTMEPLIGTALMAVEPGLVFSLIDCMFGGDGKPLNRIREFTLIEQRMMKKFCVEVLARLEQSWAVVQAVKIAFRKTEVKPEFVHLASPGEMMLVVVFSIKGNAFAGNIHLCISHLMLEPVKDRLSAPGRREKDAQPNWGDKLQELLKDTPVSIIAELGRTVHTVGEVLKLKVDDVLQLPTGPKDQIVLKVDGVPKYYGFPGTIKGNRAVEIIRPIR